jgi:hypothetical protein
VRHCRPAKQRIWLGPGRYRGSCRQSITNSKPESYANSNGYAFSVRPSGIADADGNGNGDNNGYSHPNGNGYRHVNSNGYSYSDSDSHSYGNAFR